MQYDYDRSCARITAEQGAAPPGVGHGRIEIGTAPPLGGSRPVVYGSIANRAEAKEWLTARLDCHLMRLPGHGVSLSARGLPAVEADSLGRPFLFWPGSPVPAVSFSHAKGRTWACLAWTSGVGIDVAYPEEFHSPYPFGRVFRSGELDQARGLCGGGLLDRAALLWSLKEAAVKALGCGFNFFCPLEVGVRVLGPQDGGLLSEVDAGRVLPAWARRDGRAWMAIALGASF
jgi:hypothetical protein